MICSAVLLSLKYTKYFLIRFYCLYIYILHFINKPHILIAYYALIFLKIPRVLSVLSSYSYLSEEVLYFKRVSISSVKWSDPGYFLGIKVNFLCHFYVPFFYIFLTPKIYVEHLKSFLGRSILHYYHFLQYLDNHLGHLINLKHIRNI